MLCLLAATLGLVTQGCDAGNAENLCTLIVTGNCVDFSLSKQHCTIVYCMIIYTCGENLIKLLIIIVIIIIYYAVVNDL